MKGGEKPSECRAGKRKDHNKRVEISFDFKDNKWAETL